MGIKNFIEKMLGVDKLKDQIANETIEAMNIAKEAEQRAKDAIKLKEEAEYAQKQAHEAEQRANEAAELSKLTEKDRATRKKEPWIGVLDTHVNKDNIRNGFFELDWNDEFVIKLKQEGYGANGDLDEEIVDRWFRELCANVVIDGDYGGPITTGMIDVKTVLKSNK